MEIIDRVCTVLQEIGKALSENSEWTLLWIQQISCLVFNVKTTAGISSSLADTDALAKCGEDFKEKMEKLTIQLRSADLQIRNRRTIGTWYLLEFNMKKGVERAEFYLTFNSDGCRIVDNLSCSCEGCYRFVVAEGRPSEARIRVFDADTLLR